MKDTNSNDLLRLPVILRLLIIIIVLSALFSLVMFFKENYKVDYLETSAILLTLAALIFYTYYAYINAYAVYKPYASIILEQIDKVLLQF